MWLMEVSLQLWNMDNKSNTPRFSFSTQFQEIHKILSYFRKANENQYIKKDFKYFYNQLYHSKMYEVESSCLKIPFTHYFNE